jgi:hypothetical protein
MKHPPGGGGEASGFTEGSCIPNSPAVCAGNRKYIEKNNKLQNFGFYPMDLSAGWACLPGRGRSIERGCVFNGPMSDLRRKNSGASRNEILHF